MDMYYMFLDESGNSDIKSYEESPFFTICGVVISEKIREPLKKDFEDLKTKYFNNKNFVLHSVKLRRNLKWNNKKNPNILHDFSIDLDKLLKRYPFFLLLAVVDKEKAFNRSWVKKAMYEKIYRSIVGNLIKFLIAKKVKGSICSEACTEEQDIFLYQSFFHYSVNGLDRLGISPKDVKEHLTSLSFVTKKNNDIEEQIADLFGSFGRIEKEIKQGKKDIKDLDEINLVLYNRMKTQLFKASATTKKDLYKEINSFVLLP